MTYPATVDTTTRACKRQEGGPLQLSVLMAVYKGDRVEWLRESLDSLCTQTRPAKQIVVVLDGPVSEEHRATLTYFEQLLPLSTIPLQKNLGLGAALQAAMPYCHNEYIARMDADDICVPERFEKQLSFLENNPAVDIVGTWIGEFDPAKPERIYAYRRVPETHEQILRIARRRNPFNHMSVIVRKSAIEKAGGYRAVRGLEDYDLWVRMLRSGAIAGNIPEALVWARAGRELLRRRGGTAYLAREYLLFLDFYKSGFIGLRDLVAALTARTAVRLVPKSIRELAYQAIRFADIYK